MRISIILPLALFAQVATAQTSTCPSSVSTQQNCGAFHYHVQMWRPDTKVPTEVMGVNRFASLNACESARALEAQRNKSVIDFFKKLKPDGPEQMHRFGPCHCDTTTDRNSPVYLDDAARMRQLRAYEDVTGRIRERLLDRGATSDSEVVRSLAVVAPNLASTQWTKNIPPIPPAAPATASASELKNTAVGTETGSRGTAAIDMPLAPIDAKSLVPRMTATPEQLAQAAERVEPLDGDSPLDGYVNYELARVDEIMKGSSKLSEDEMRTRILEACMERTQLLENLRAIAEIAGPKSRLTTAAAGARDESSRLAFVAKLFGPEVQNHWAPADAKGAVIQFPPDVVNDSTAVLRDPAERYTHAQRKLALYYVLAKNASLVSNQQLWISEIIDGFLAP